MNKIILIDDNKSNQREIYGATFVDNGEFEDCLIHKEKLNENHQSDNVQPVDAMEFFQFTPHGKPP
mgnify:CR=1 FL=1